MVLAQISDLHFGGDMQNRRKLLSGFEFALTKHPVSPVVICGDVTNAGKNSEYTLAWTYLNERIVFDHMLSTGLGLDREKFVAVPGNHDHWCGRPWFFAGWYDRTIWGRHFDPAPWVRSLKISADVDLQLLGIDSNSGKANWKGIGASIWKLSEGGIIDADDWGRLGDKAILETKKSRAKYILRVLVLHHSLYRSGLAGPLCDRSQADLRDFARRYGVAVLLTGHTHDFLRGEAHSWLGWNESFCSLYELRSPATLVDTKSQNAGFLCHNVVQTGVWPAVHWTVSRFSWNGARFRRKKTFCFFPVLVDRVTGYSRGI